MRSIPHFFLLITVLLTASCVAKTPESNTIPTPAAMLTDPATGLMLPPGYQAEIVGRGLNLPTHITTGADGVLYLTQLNGGENDQKGQVVRLADSKLDVVLDGLHKPTGLAWADDALYIVAGNNVLKSSFKDDKFESPGVIWGDLPFNGRSNGQIFAAPDGMLYFQSTGNEGKIRDSGFIYVAKADGTDRKVYARELKNAYAMAWSPTGQMYATEIGDGIIQNIGPFPEELNLIHFSGNYGWPYCYANQKENRAIGGNRNICADTDSPIAIFPSGSTPTGLAWFDSKLIVALWNGNPPRLISVDPANGAVSEFASGFKRPIALLTTSDHQLLVVDMDAGVVYRLTK
jgi:glucose/arabinose dehydrogenase